MVKKKKDDCVPLGNQCGLTKCQRPQEKMTYAVIRKAGDSRQKGVDTKGLEF